MFKMWQYIIYLIIFRIVLNRLCCIIETVLNEIEYNNEIDRIHLYTILFNSLRVSKRIDTKQFLKGLFNLYR